MKKMCKDCLYYNKLKSEIESKRLKKTVICCDYREKPIIVKEVNKLTKCEMFSSVKPD